MSRRYVAGLDEPSIMAHAEHTHAMWGMGASMQAHAAHQLEQQARSAGILDFVGLFESGELVASLKRFRVMLATPHGEVPAIGIGAVFTPEAHRRRGHATHLIAEVMAEARAAGAGAAWLYSDIPPSYYERQGFTVLAHPVWSAPLAALPASSELTFQPTDDVTQMLALYRSSWSGAWLHAVRTEASWRFFAWKNCVERSWLLLEHSEPVGYVVGKRWADALWIDDLTLAKMPAERAWAALGGLAREVGASKVSGWLRPEHTGGPFSETVRDRCIPMVAPLDHRLAGASWRSHFSALDHF